MTSDTTKTMLLFLLWCLLLLAAPGAYADFYRYQDGAGTVCVTDNPASVPRQYRAGAKVVRNAAGIKGGAAVENHAGQDALPLKSAAEEPGAPAREQGRFAELASRYPLIKPLAVVGGLLVGLVAVLKVGGLFQSRQLGRLVSTVFFLGILVYLYTSFAGQMTGRYQVVKKQIQSTLKMGEPRPSPPKGLDDEVEPSAKR